jgi:hypothetical protein
MLRLYDFKCLNGHVFEALGGASVVTVLNGLSRL